jgi:hypothetical protein
MLKRHLANFVTYAKHWLINAVAKGLNGKSREKSKPPVGSGSWSTS